MELNALGLKCPMPIVRLGQAVRQAKVGEQITIVADDGPFPSDLRAWCKMTGHSLVSLDDSDPKRYVAVIKKEKP
jgi:tRNA 2-thiouridine synthesizing protein A